MKPVWSERSSMDAIEREIAEVLEQVRQQDAAVAAAADRSRQRARQRLQQAQRAARRRAGRVHAEIRRALGSRHGRAVLETIFPDGLAGVLDRRPVRAAARLGSVADRLRATRECEPAPGRYAAWAAELEATSARLMEAAHAVAAASAGARGGPPPLRDLVASHDRALSRLKAALGRVLAPLPGETGAGPAPPRKK